MCSRRELWKSIYTHIFLFRTHVHTSANTDTHTYKHTTICTGGNAKKEEDLITPVDVPDIDESVMSYRAALLGNSAPTLEESRPPPEAVKVNLI